VPSSFSTPSHPVCPSADDALGVLVHVVTIALLKGVFVLRVYITVADIYGVQFIGTNSTIEHFRRPALASKNHLSPNFTSGTGKGQSSLPTREKRAVPSPWIHGNTFFSPGFDDEITGSLPVFELSPR